MVKDASKWTVQIKIPWIELGITPPKNGAQIRGNFYRTRSAGDPLTQSSWTPLQGNAYYQPEDFGTLILSR